MKSKAYFSRLVTIYHANQCDPKKCTGLKTWHLFKQRKFSSVSNLKLVKKMSQIPRFSLILNPLSRQTIMMKDKNIFEKSGLTILDCSWNHTENIFSKDFPNLRRLPTLIAANPVNYGRASKLSSIEALSAALYLVGETNAANELLSFFKWGKQFLSLNNDLLNDYLDCQSEKEIRQTENEYFGQENIQ
ncbi:MAG: DUF367 family protein [Candidatus Hodarchaeales archaeon]